MNLHDKVNQILTLETPNELITKMGYYNANIGEKALQHFIESKNMFTWIKLGYFDFTHDSISFANALARLLDIDISEELTKVHKDLEKIASMVSPYIFVDTHKKRQTRPIYIRRSITIEKEQILFIGEENFYLYIGGIIQSHYKDNKGYLPVWGNIEKYIYHHSDGKIYVFDINGNFIKEQS